MAPANTRAEASRQNQEPNEDELRNRTQRVEATLEQVVNVLGVMAANMQNHQAGQNQQNPPLIPAADRHTSILKEFQRLNPTEFAGTEGPLEA